MFLKKQLVMIIRSINRNWLTNLTPYFNTSFQQIIVTAHLSCKTASMNVLFTYVTSFKFSLLLDLGSEILLKLKSFQNNYKDINGEPSMYQRLGENYFITLRKKMQNVKNTGGKEFQNVTMLTKIEYQNGRRINMKQKKLHIATTER